MKKSSNSISTLLPQLLRLFNNTLEGFEKISEAVTGSSENVAIDLRDDNDVLKRVFVPSFGYMKNRIESFENNIKGISETSTGESNVKLSDGSFRKVILSKLEAEAKDIISLNSVNTFKTRNNHFFESFINPMMYITFDVSGQVPINTEQILVNRYILDIDSQSKKNWFEINYKGKSDVVYETFLRDLLEQGIGYILDNDTVDLPPRDLRFVGDFGVLRITDVDFSEEVNGVTYTSKKKSFKLDKFTYTDIKTGFKDTVSLKVNDFLVVNSEVKDTRYKIIGIDSSTNTVVLELVEGYKSPSIGTEIFSIFSGKDDSVEARVNIGFNEYTVVFIKAIDSYSMIPSKNWSPGSSFYSNDLLIKNSSGIDQTLESYYKSEVVDFGAHLLALAKDNIPPSTLGLIPFAPDLNPTDFSVVQINKQITSNKTIEEIVTLQSQKTSLNSELKELDNSIKNKRAAIASKIYNNNSEREADKNELKNLVLDRTTKGELFSAIVKDIESKSTADVLYDATPKYRLRGFFPQPQNKVSNLTGEQKVIQYEIAYRYLSKDGVANPVDQLPFDDNGVQRDGVLSGWEEYKTKTLPREYNASTGRYEWIDQKVEDADVININTVDISIRKGESVEFKVRSICEAGYPSNPMSSEWSESVIVPFPDDIDTSNKIDKLYNDNKIDLQRVKLLEDLGTQGVLTHIEGSFTANEKYFPHSANQIASGFFTPEQKPIDMFEKISEMTLKLIEFEQILKKIKGVLTVKISDEDGKETLIKKDKLNTFFAGYYADIVANYSVKKGVIISKTFFLILENTAATPLELISRMPGLNTKKVNVSESSTGTILPALFTQYSNVDTFNASDNDYNLYKKYDLVPIVLANPNSPDGEIAARTPYQSSQVKAQFIYNRYMDVAGDETFYSYAMPDTNGAATVTNVVAADLGEYSYARASVGNSSNTNDFIWGGRFIISSGVPVKATILQYENNTDAFDVHVSHPYLANATAFAAAYNALINPTVPLAVPTTGTYWDVRIEAKQLFRQSKFAKLDESTPLGKKQNIYLYDSGTGVTTSSDLPAGFKRTIKCAFDSSDSFLLGQRSCGAYLFMASNTHKDLIVDGTNLISKKEIKQGSDNAIKIPIIFQYRMTDYFGSGNTGLGNIGGDVNNTIINRTYTKRMGIDILDVDNNYFSFDLEVYAKYKSDNLNLEIIPSRSIQVALDDVKRVISGISPNIVETRIDQNRTK